MTGYAEALRRMTEREIERRRCVDDECRRVAEQAARDAIDVADRLGIGRPR